MFLGMNGLRFTQLNRTQWGFPISFVMSSNQQLHTGPSERRSGKRQTWWNRPTGENHAQQENFTHLPPRPCSHDHIRCLHLQKFPSRHPQYPTDVRPEKNKSASGRVRIHTCIACRVLTGTYNASPLGWPSRAAIRVILQLRHVVDTVRDLLVCWPCHDAEFIAHAVLTTCAVESEDLLVGSRN